ATAFGDGVEHEVRNNVFERFVKAGSVFLEPGEGGFMVPRTLFTGDSPIPIPAPRLAAWKRFGVICGLLFVAGNLPPTISPAVFQYLIHNCNFHSLHPAFIGEWYPELRALILSWLAMDPADQNLAAYDSQFINFHNVSASAFRIRDLATHLALAVTMLFRAVLGQTGYSQEELQYFRTGFQLRCSNGFTLPAAIRNFEGGSEPFLCLTATSHISSADSVLTHLNVVTPANFLPLLGALQTLTNDITLTFDMLVERYLRGVGTPCPQRFAGARDAFHPIIDLSKITTRAFRARCLVWAATGTPFLDPGRESDHIRFGPIGTHEGGYGEPGSTAADRNRLASSGTFHIQTCHRTLRYPVEYALHLAEGNYASDSEPASFQDAFDFWFLQQCLLAIGRHNMH
ncbi:hypothetical protein C8R46DRAFT_926163, partial [Mycena filopes]